jgi:putative phosphoribosyl transferase
MPEWSWCEVFIDRIDAGRKLAGALRSYSGQPVTVLGIPMGGIPVAHEVAASLAAEMDIVVPRKLPIPWNPEAGFGAMTIDGNVVLNPQMIANVGLTRKQIEAVSEMVMEEIRRRRQSLRGGRLLPPLPGRTAIVVDDGLASGYTMVAAIKYVRTLGPLRVVAAVPVTSAQAARLVQEEADDLVTLVVTTRIPFAVASFYLNWHDLSDEDVRVYLEEPGIRKEA